MSEELWSPARLIPTSGISGAEEQERRATSALLAVMGAVKEFSRSLLSPLGAPAGAVDVYIEVPFILDGRRLFPDGLIRVVRGGKTWTALVEVKTGRNTLEPEQLQNYLDIARENDFDCLITISNEIPAVAGQHPTTVDRRKLRKVQMHHWSWSHLLATAVVQKEHRGVSDPEQAWILGELIRYLEHPKSGALEFADMGQNWVAVREAVVAGTLRANDKTIPDVVTRFDGLLRFASLQLGRQLGTEVAPALSRKEIADPALRSQALTTSLVANGELVGAIRIPNAIGHVVLTANLRSGRITAHVDVDGPRDGRNTTRVNWLIRQLKHAGADVRIESFAANARGAGAADLLGKVREDPSLLIIDPAKELRTFRIARTVPMGPKSARGRGHFIDSCLDLIDTFYADVVQHLRPWNAPAPRFREREPEVIPPERRSVDTPAESMAAATDDVLLEPATEPTTTPEPVAALSSEATAVPAHPVVLSPEERDASRVLLETLDEPPSQAGGATSISE